jgi:drug/metabolite transporter (DMT)-like permease
MGLIIGFIGVGMILGFQTVSSTKEFLGALLVMGAAISWASSGYVIKLRYKGLPAMQTTLVACFVAVVLTLPLAMMNTPTSPPLLKSTLVLIVQGVFCTALLYTINNIVLTNVGVGFWNIVLYIQPVFVVLLGYVFLNERISEGTFAGVALILVGITLRTRTRKPLVQTVDVESSTISEPKLRAPPPVPDVDIQIE